MVWLMCIKIVTYNYIMYNDVNDKYASESRRLVCQVNTEISLYMFHL
jgi:hypothetical protein